MTPDPSTRPDSPLRRALLGAGAAAGALAALPARAAPRTLAERQWLAEPDTVAGPVTTDFNDPSYYSTHGHGDLQLRQAVAGTGGRGAFTYSVIDNFRPQPSLPIRVDGFLGYRRGDGGGWQQADYSADYLDLLFTRNGDVISAIDTYGATYSSLRTIDLHLDDGSTHGISTEAQISGYWSAPALERRSGEVLLPYSRRADYDAPDPLVRFLRRDARSRVWSIAPGGVAANGKPLQLFEDPCGALILVAQSATGVTWFRQASAGGAWSGPAPVPLPADFPQAPDVGNPGSNQVAIDEHGTFHLLWLVPGPPGNSNRRTLRYAQITPAGRLLPSRTLAIGDIYYGLLQPLAGGQMALRWRFANGERHLAFRLPDGNIYAAPPARGDIALDRFGNALTVWSDDAAGTEVDNPRYFTEDYVPSHIWARTRVRGQPWQAPVRIDGSGTGPRRRVKPVAAMAPDGTAIAAWITATVLADPTLPLPDERRWVERRIEAQVLA